MIKNNTIQAYWEDFKNSVISENALEIQVLGAKQTFYAGALAVLTISMILGEKAMEEGVTTESSLKDLHAKARVISELHNECKSFFEGKL